MVYDIKRPEYAFTQPETLEIFQVFLKFFHNLQPIKYPGFAYAWLELISNKYFMQTALSTQEIWPDYHLLLLSLFKFFKQNSELLNSPYMQTFYKGAPLT